ncbi:MULTISPECIES: hypothetical protein [Collinsella]|uniref:hypothetical protein n=1 Tax=Collinsella TaxID=102106 RepID=UPI000B37D025|nr:MULTISPECIES: hypothetical protein [Collinsella]MBM6942685.1 hypothetical protein [Collinsella intestinalis]OUO64602.1 hypothetical protein B5F70_05085 [Collinsella sp. An268]
MQAGKFSLHLVVAYFKSGIAPVVLLILAISSLLPAFPQHSIVSFSAEEPDYYQELYQEQQDYIETGLIDDMPAYLQEITREQTRALDSVVNASDSQAYYAGIAQYTDTLIATYDNGNLVGTDRQSLVAEKNLYSALSKLDDPQLYHDSSEMPALPYTCYVFAQISPIIWLILPLTCAAFIQAITKRPHLLGGAPVSTPEATIADLAVPSLLPPTLLMVALLPAFLFVGSREGFGSTLYPVVFVQNCQVIQTTVGTTLLCQLSLFFCACVFISSVTLLLSQVSQNAVFSLVVTACLCLLPTMDSYFNVLYQNDMTAQLKTFLPLTYLSFGHIAGYPGAFPSLDILPFEGASFQTGVAVLLVSAAVVVAIALSASHLVSAYRAHRRVNYDA